jgi:Mrp family chromosome partitioning ATPase
VTLQLALALSLQGRSVGILDVDLTGPSIPRLVGLEDAKITQAPGGWVPVMVHQAEKDGEAESSRNPSTGTSRTAMAGGGTEAEPTAPSSENPPQEEQRKPRGSLRCMSLGFLLRDRGDAVIWRGPKKTAMVRQFLTDVLWGETDYLLIDTPPGTSDEHIALAEQLLTLSATAAATTSTSTSNTTNQPPRLAGAVLVTTPQAISTADVRKEINFCQKTRIPVLGVVENMAGYACPCCGEVSNVFSRGGGQVMATEMGVPFLGAVPIDVGFGEMVEGRKVVLDGEEDEGEDGGVVVLPNAEEDKEEGRLLVDRYRDCWSYPIFKGFSESLLRTIESPAGE